jgi:hypothetical protein
MRAEAQSSSEPNLWKGLQAGASGGLIASFAMTEFYSMVLSPESNSEPGKEDNRSLQPTISTSLAKTARLVFRKDVIR